MKAILLFTILLTVSVAVSAQSTQLPQPSEMVTIPLIRHDASASPDGCGFHYGCAGLGPCPKPSAASQALSRKPRGSLGRRRMRFLFVILTGITGQTN